MCCNPPGLVNPREMCTENSRPLTNDKGTMTRVTSLVFTKDTTEDDIKKKIRSAPGLLKLEVNACSAFDDDLIAELAPAFNDDLMHLIAIRVPFSNSGIQTTVTRCQNVQTLTFIDCENIGKDCMRAIGACCRQLKSVAFVYENGNTWTLVDDALSLLVKNCASELTSISFVGFDSITDIGVNYVAECYFETLLKVNFSYCSQLTDRSLVGLATLCRYLRDVSLATTGVTDAGLQLLADKCTRLHRLDFSHCLRITDQGIRSLALKCEKLEDVNFDGCSKLTEDSFLALCTHCLGIHTLNYSRTLLRTVSVLILSLKRLRVLKLDECVELTNPPPEFVSRGLEGILEYYKEYNLSYRVKVVVVGDSGAGKSSLVKSLVKGEATLVKEPTEGVMVHLWAPYPHPRRHTTRRPKADQRQLLLELWDLTGRKVCHGVQQVCFTPDAIYLVVFNAASKPSSEHVYTHIKAIQCKAPGSVILLVGTHHDQLSKDLDFGKLTHQLLFNAVNSEEQSLENVKKEINRLKTLDIDHKVLHRIEDLDLMVVLKPKLPNNVHLVSCLTGEGVDELWQTLVRQALDYDQFQHLGRSMKPGCVQLYARLLARRQAGHVLLSWTEYRDLALGDVFITTDNQLEADTEFLQFTGAILDFRFLDVSDAGDEQVRWVCIHPENFVNAALLVHVDNPKKAFKIKANRFWPLGTGVRKPDPGTLVRALEDIPTRGLIRECLLPLLWQDLELTQDQVQRLVALMERLGILVAQQVTGNHSNGLGLPNFPDLSVNTCYCAPQLGLLRMNKPELNWAPRPFEGDIQVNWRYEFPNGVPRGLLQRFYGVSRRTAPPDAYCHMWKDGVLMVLDEAVVHVKQEDQTVELCCRVNADDDTQHRAAVEFLWAALSPFVFAAHQFLITYTGLFFKVSLLCFGRALFFDDAPRREHSFDLMTCLGLAERGENTSFTENQQQMELDVGLLIPFSPGEHRSVEAYIHFIVTKRTTILSLMDSGALPPISRALPSESKLPQPPKEGAATYRRQRKTKRRPEVTWNLAVHEEDVKKDTSPPVTAAPPSPHPGDPGYKPLTGEDINRNIEKVQAEFGVGDKMLQPMAGNVVAPNELELLHIASGFVSAILAGATAEFIRLEFEDNHSNHDNKNNHDYTARVMSAAQVEAAQMTASAAKATQFGDMDAAARAVVAAADRVQTLMISHAAHAQLGGVRSVKSKLCIIL